MASNGMNGTGAGYDGWFDGRVAVVTGAGRALGQVVAKAFADAGASVALLDISDGVVGVADELAVSSGASTVGIVCDVSDEASVAAAHEAVRARFGPCDALVNNAGVIQAGPIEQLTVADWDRVVAVNLRGCFLMTRAFGAGMLERERGAIVNIASTAHLQPVPGGGAYPATKAAIVTLTEQVALEWGARGVRTNAVSPGMVDSRMGHAERTTETAKPAIPLGRLGALEEIAAAVLFLASDAASYVNGATLEVDGGLTRAMMREVHRSGEHLPPEMQAFAGGFGRR